MVIKHIVLQGGGAVGFRYIGMLQYLFEKGFYDINNIENIYATSIGTLIGAFLCLKHSWDDLIKYIEHRPWENVFRVSGQSIINLYSTKGLFDEQIIASILKPLLVSKGLTISTTLEDLFIFSNINAHFFTFNLNKHETIDLNHVSYPDLPLIKAIFMSSAFPILCTPIIIDGNCFVDGGILCNYPLHICVDEHSDSDEILGVRYTLRDNTINQISEESNLIDYILALLNIQIIPIEQQHPIHCIKNEIVSICEESPMNVNILLNISTSSIVRKEWIDHGRNDAKEWLESRVESNL